ncbi:uncharacterized protein LOC132295929 [Cornus florida]|uniref:uncharacterized protein LOC132295929 n=1 Tax=Cornus florida TaxID=4283 RepID=UPI0028990EB7|nr:uncharacterized protein LOC132295929 [Cornus florida]
MNEVMQLLSPENVKAFFRRRKRRYIKRDREEAAQRLFQDYFVENPTFPPEMFRRRFRMRRELFIRILNGVTAYDEWFIQKPDALGRMGQYQCTPNEEDIACLLREGEEKGFPGMLGSIDCMHWIWHAFFGMASSNNDVNVLNHFPTFNSLINGTMPPINYKVNGYRRTMGYYLSDGIYPKWVTLIQTIPHPTISKDKLFAKKQEAVRKDVERAFGVLQIRWAITQGPVYYWDKEDLNEIMRMCIILHNMIIEDERGHILQWTPPPDEPISFPHIFETQQCWWHTFPVVLEEFVIERIMLISGDI